MPLVSRTIPNLVQGVSQQPEVLRLSSQATEQINGFSSVVEGLKKRLENETGRFGDRRCHLTVIGDKNQVDWFTDSLKQCFLTDNEIAHWQSGGEFPDPWPDNYVTREH